VLEEFILQNQSAESGDFPVLIYSTGSVRKHII